MAKLTPYIFSEDAKAQAEFYVQALGGEIQGVMTFGQAPEVDEAIKDKVMHLSFVAAGVTFFMSDSVYMPFARGTGMDLNLTFASEEEAHQAYDKLSEGGKALDPLKKQFWGALFGRLEDKYGVHWQVSTE